MKTRTQRIESIKADIRAAATAEANRPGQRFFSNRAIAQRYEINYRTAHRLLQELKEENVLIRKPCSGSYLPGIALPTRVRLVISPKAQIVNNLRHYALNQFMRELDQRRIDYHITYTNRWRGGNSEEYFVFYGEMYGLRQSLGRIRRALHVNIYNTPLLPLTDDALQLDLLTVDMNEAGKLAVQHFREILRGHGSVAFVHHKSELFFDKVFEPFKNSFPDGLRLGITERSPGKYGFGREALNIAARRFDGILCSSAKIGSEILSACSSLAVPSPRIVCMDRYKYTENLRLTAVTIPYEEPIVHSINIISRRMSGDQSPPVHIDLKPRLIERDS